MLTPRLPAGRPTGLTNVGNSCFANATLQCLFTISPFLRYFLRLGHSASCQLSARKQFCLLCAIEDLVKQHQPAREPVNPKARAHVPPPLATVLHTILHARGISRALM